MSRKISFVFLVVVWSSPVRAEITWTGDVNPVNPNTWTSNSVVSIGSVARGTLTVDANSDVLADRSYIGYSSEATGRVTVDGTGTTWTNTGGIQVGYSGQGTLAITDGGRVESLYAHIGRYPNSRGQVTVDGTDSFLTSNHDLRVGERGQGMLAITGGGAVSNGSGVIGYLPGSAGHVNVNGTDSNWKNRAWLVVGRRGEGTLAITNGGAVTVAKDTFVGWSTDTGSEGKINFDNGTLSTGGLAVAPDDLTGMGIINTRGLVSDVDLIFDASHGLSQTITFDDLPEQNITVNMNVDGSGSMGTGYAGTSAMRVADGVSVESTNGYVGFKPGSNGSVTVGGTDSTWTNREVLYVGVDGAGTLAIMDSGLVSVGGTLAIDVNADGDGFVNMASGGILALYGNADDSIFEFLDLVVGTDAIRHWDNSLPGWAPITAATEGVDYSLEYFTAGDLTGYTVLTVHTAIPEPVTMMLLIMVSLALMCHHRMVKT